jgi:hypothetical protein
VRKQWWANNDDFQNVSGPVFDLLHSWVVYVSLPDSVDAELRSLADLRQRRRMFTKLLNNEAATSISNAIEAEDDFTWRYKEQLSKVASLFHSIHQRDNQMGVAPEQTG